MDAEMLVLVTVVGLLIGFVGGYGAVGGGPLIVIFLTTIFGYTQQMAQGTALAVFLGPMSLLGVWYLRDRAKRHVGTILWVLFGFIFGGYLGAEVAYLFSNNGLRIVFSAIMLCVGGYYILTSRTKESDSKEIPISIPAYHAIWIGALAGIGGGLVGIGGGIVIVPILTKVFKMSKDNARAISLAVLLPPSSIGGVIKYQASGDVDWLIAVVLLGAYLLTNYFGAKLASRHTNREFSRYFGFVMILLAITNFYLIV